ncbi:hypothetical protein Bint_0323 [Brachyspira intermedia PWS/A]|uniref:DUF262 domain-containing protein n=1 Tax=Brachyspira intermedia (strain ATCC 51140 / PWS/A) TaxID=1045858 RepID=G0EHZ4_BRAIP|nr:DUF262 domain-containing protein [Brachyspira intermedia]AEM20957.1 hypothetical protein Bint_0323 [Brachyspira intermedia PWS/A]
MTEEIKNNDDIIESVKEIFSNGRIYNIPEYQRGYKWSEEDVNALLNDINNFQAEGDKFYCLQNITIKKQKDSENIYEVIDGQQRLTTLSILLSYLGKTDLLKQDNNNNNKYKIKYSIRKESQEFLYKLLKETNNDYLNDNLSYNDKFDKAVKDLKKENKDYDRQDVFHFCLAKHTIINFFYKFDEDKKKSFTTKLLNNVKLIVNDVSSGNDVKGETIFKNLNSNKVALEYYDLIRAIFITRVAKKGNDIDLAEKRIKIDIDIDNMNIWWSDENVKEKSHTTTLLNNAQLILNYLDNGNNTKAETIFISKEKEANDIDLAEKRIKIGIDIDNMNIWWSDENVKEYFKMFSNENNISMLYDLYWKCRNNESNNNNEKSDAYKSQSNNEALFKYLDSNTDKAEVVFKEVVRFHNTMADWYEDKEIYHLLGFIGKQNIEDIKIIWDIWERANTTRESFKKALKQIIKNNLIKNIENENYLETIGDPNKNWYYQENNTIKLLVLMDIIKILNNKDIKYKLPVNYFNRNEEDIEHIFSKTPNDETTIKEAKENIDLIISSLEEYKREKITEDNDLKKFMEDNDLKKFEDKLPKLNNENNKQTLKDLELLDEYRRVIREVPYVHSIGNLVLLNSNTNRGYGNSSYIEKRRIIIELYESGNKYIRNHTWTVFSKNINEWTIDNIKNTAEDIRKEIEKFFDDNNK